MKKEEKTKASKAIAWLKTKRYYIVLLICVSALSLSFFVSSLKNQNRIANLDNLPVFSNETKFSANPVSGASEENKDYLFESSEDEHDNYMESFFETEMENNTSEYEYSNNYYEIPSQEEYFDEVATVSADEITTLFFPVDGNIIVEHSNDKLVYSKTLDDWRIHEGVDIKTEAGAPVYPAFEGIIEDISQNDELGICITIKHNDSVKTKYCNLAKADTVSVGQSVKTGEIIGEVGNTSLYETGEVNHLHFEVLVDGESIDPLKFLKRE